MKHILAVARNSFRETVRDRIFYLVGIFGFVMVASSAVLSPMTIGAQGKIVADVGLAGMSLFGLFVTVFVGSNMVRKEIDKGTVLTILTKPLSRRQYLVGKFLGLNLTLVSMLAVMGLLFVAALLVTPAQFAARYFAAIYFTYLELMIVTAAVVFFSTFASPVLAAMLTIGLFVIGHLSESLRNFGDLLGGELQQRVLLVVYYVVPNLEMFNVRGMVVHGDSVSQMHLALATVYCLGYTGILLIVAGAIFARKELR
jgi:ABC-type transport system involved in multi-copper enzyme maturation permease subunit